MTGVNAADAATQADAHPLVARVRRFGFETLKPSLLETEQSGVTSQTVHCLGELGALNHLAPTRYGGAAVDDATERRLHEQLAYACFNTWLVWAQHEAGFRRVLAAEGAGGPRSQVSEDILCGRALVGSAASDVRHFPDRYIEARRVHGGWRLDGTISWLTGWGLHAALAVAAVEPGTESVILSLVPVDAGMRSVPLGLTVLAGSRTERVELRDVFVSADNVLLVTPLDGWRRQQGSADARAAAFGLASAVLEELRAEEDPAAQEVAARWAPRVSQLRSEAYALADADAQVGHPARRPERAAVKAAVGEALSILTRALIIARAGRGLTVHNTAQFYARAVLYLLVQGPTPAVRQAQLSYLADAAGQVTSSR